MLLGLASFDHVHRHRHAGMGLQSASTSPAASIRTAPAAMTWGAYRYDFRLAVYGTVGRSIARAIGIKRQSQCLAPGKGAGRGTVHGVIRFGGLLVLTYRYHADGLAA